LGSTAVSSLIVFSSGKDLGRFSLLLYSFFFLDGWVLDCRAVVLYTFCVLCRRGMVLFFRGEIFTYKGSLAVFWHRCFCKRRGASPFLVLG